MCIPRLPLHNGIYGAEKDVFGINQQHNVNTIVKRKQDTMSLLSVLDN